MLTFASSVFRNTLFALFSSVECSFPFWTWHWFKEILFNRWGQLWTRLSWLCWSWRCFGGSPPAVTPLFQCREAPELWSCASLGLQSPFLSQAWKEWTGFYTPRLYSSCSKISALLEIAFLCLTTWNRQFWYYSWVIYLVWLYGNAK